MDMEQNTKEPTELQKVLDKLGPRQTVVKDAIAALATQGIKVSKSAMYQVVTGRSARRELVEAFLVAAEAEAERRELVKQRAAKLAS
ncbi:hypothetical protein [Hymenobacter sp.]|jgi:hypothetical protein|uniref:hypothetical protein n=1 Tax=Hymenobacter sp. TaxID=1898978 RepID=UPI002ED857CC